MGHTNSTTNYSLPQFLTTDKPAWLTDINGAFNDIDSAIHSAQTDATTAGNNATQALSDASSASTAASAADAKGAGAVASIENAFDATAVYSVGAKVMYNSLLYRCTVAVVTPGPWTGSANWERITVDSLIPMTADDLPVGSGANPGSTGEAIANLQTAVGTIPSISHHSTTLALSGTKTAFTDLNMGIGRIIPQGATLIADAGVPVTVSLQIIDATTTRLRVSTNTAYTSNVSVNYLTIT